VAAQQLQGAGPKQMVLGGFGFERDDMLDACGGADPADSRSSAALLAQLDRP
jgi:hypothetical protein